MKDFSETNPMTAEDADQLSEGWPLRDGAKALNRILAAERKSTEVARFADVAMYEAAPIEVGESGLVEPKVTIINATSMPLRTMAAATATYAGQVRRSPLEVTAEEAMAGLEDMTRTALKAGLEFIDFHFYIEGVSRGLTHQMVRQRTAVYIQESMRFAVKDGERIPAETTMPPSISALKDDDPRRAVWDATTGYIAEAYDQLIGAGIPAEDARGLLPTNISTRIHYKTNLRGLMEMSGVRLCTQSQFEWRQLWAAIVSAVHSYATYGENLPGIDDQWEFQQIAKLFKPICYRTGKCEFQGSADRHCNIRERVNAHHDAGEPSTVWLDIHPAEWLADPAAARQK